MTEKIYVNCRFLTQKITGVQRFAIEICKQLKSRYDELFVFVAPHNIINESVANLLSVRLIGKHKGHLWEQYDLPQYLRMQNTPPLLNLCNSAPLFYDRKFITQHDVNYVRYPESFSKAFRLLYNNMVKYNTKHCLHIFTVSHHSKDELGLIYGIVKDKISVINNSVDSKFHHVEDKDLYKESYILAASSSPTPNKNFEATIGAFMNVLKQNSNIKLYVFGDCKSHKVSGCTMDVTPYKNHPKIKFLGRVDDDMLVKVYSNAIAFIYPSRYEGFGIPPLEAQACGCPVVSSLLSSLPEVLGDSALLCDPNDHEALANALFSIISDDKQRNELIKKGYDNVKRFSWERSAERLVEDMLRVINE